MYKHKLNKTSNKNLVKVWFWWRILSKLCIDILIIDVISDTNELLLSVGTCQQHDGDANDIFTWYSSRVRWISLPTSITTFIYTVFRKKEATKLLPITFSKLNRFSKFFHCWIEDEYFQQNRVIFSTTP